MCVFLISPVPIAEPLTSELIDTPVFHNLAPRPIKYRVSVPIPTADIVKRMDAFDTLTVEICDLVSKRLENIDEAFNDQLKKERVRIALNKDEQGSVFGNTKTETVISVITSIRPQLKRHLQVL